MKQEGLKERVELLEIGEKLGYPRLGYGRSTKIPHDKRIPQGKDGWEKFCAHAHVRRIFPALRIGRVLRDNNVQPFHPLTDAETRPRSSDGQEHRLGKPEVADSTSAVGSPAPDLLDDIAEANAIVNPQPRRKRDGKRTERTGAHEPVGAAGGGREAQQAKPRARRRDQLSRAAANR